MSQILDPINNENKSILCCYVNATSKIQIARITNIEHWYFERVVFPGQRLVFESFPEGLLEIHTGMMSSAFLSDTIPCEYLAISEESDDNNQNRDEKKLFTNLMINNYESYEHINVKNTSFQSSLVSVG